MSIMRLINSRVEERIDDLEQPDHGFLLQPETVAVTTASCKASEKQKLNWFHRLSSLKKDCNFFDNLLRLDIDDQNGEIEEYWPNDPHRLYYHPQIIFNEHDIFREI